MVTFIYFTYIYTLESPLTVESSTFTVPSRKQEYMLLSILVVLVPHGVGVNILDQNNEIVSKTVYYSDIMLCNYFNFKVIVCK